MIDETWNVMVDVEKRPMKAGSTAENFDPRQLRSFSCVQPLQLHARYGQADAVIKVKSDDIRLFLILSGYYAAIGGGEAAGSCQGGVDLPVCRHNFRLRLIHASSPIG